ncbi:MAG: membrane protein insertase YidC [Gemmatimonadetes bacterium]|nr:membrane protein insertase YidC [Gemmatimonadota bacterium]
MNTEVRFLLAIALMLAVLVGTNFVFPPVVPEEVLVTDSTTARSNLEGDVGGTSGTASVGEPVSAAISLPGMPGAAADEVLLPSDTEAGVTTGGTAEQRVVVEGSLYRFEFSNVGGRLRAATMTQFDALNRDGLVDLVPEGSEGYFGQKLVVGSDTVDLSRQLFRVEPEGGLDLVTDPTARTLRFVYEHPTQPFGFEVEYEFDPDKYQVVVRGRTTGLERPLLVTDLGEGLAFAESDSASEARMMAYVYNHVQEGIQSTLQDGAEPIVIEGPLLWAAFRNKFFVLALLADESDDGIDQASYLGGLLVQPSLVEGRVRLAAAQPIAADGSFAYRLYMGPQDYTRLTSLGEGMEEVNPYGWKFIRPVVRPFVSVIMTVLDFLHTKLSLGYGWVLVVFGVMMRVVLFPLNHKAMKAQLRNMAVQPLVTEIQAKYKDNPEKLQKEMMKLYKEHGFNPLAGCLPMLLPWPVLIALFFVFQNTVELRGVPFLWLSDLSAPDPLYLLPVFMGISMFLMQYVSLKSLDQVNPQMKMMMWLMPIMMIFIFFSLPGGLNLYYATANVATLPQQIWIANERKKMKGKPLPKLSKD